MSYRSWCFTLNNYTEEDEQFIYEWREDVSLLVYGREVGESGTPHLQGVVTFKRTFRFGQLKELLPRAHWEHTLDREAAIKYCKKDGDYFEISNNKQGKRTDIATAVETLTREGLSSVVEHHPVTFVKFHNGFKALAAELAQPRQPGEKPYVKWIWGPTGAGKTKWVVDTEDELWISGDDLKWFDGYNRQSAVLLDDFRDDMCPLRYLLRILDRYPLRVPIKGSFVQWIPARIYITSCKPPEKCYESSGEDIAQLTRRIDEVIFKGFDPIFNIV